MSKDTKMARNMMKLVRRYVEKHYPEEADTLMVGIEKYYRQFKAECPDLGGDDNMLAGNLDMGLIAFAAYEASDHRMGGEAIDELMEMRMEMLSKYGRILNANKKWMTWLMEASYKPYKKKLDKKLAAEEWGNTWGMEINPDGHDEGLDSLLEQILHSGQESARCSSVQGMHLPLAGCLQHCLMKIPLSCSKRECSLKMRPDLIEDRKKK